MIFGIFTELCHHRHRFGRAACGILVPRPGMVPGPPAVEVWSLNLWTAREVPGFLTES